MIHLSLLRNHARWAVFLRNLKFIVVDECHYYRGIFGSNVAMVLRRLMRLCERYSAERRLGPTVIFASATTSSPAATASELLGHTVAEVTDDGSPQGGRTVALWEPALRDDITGENGAPVRRSAGAEAARVMADLIAEGARTLTFVRSRRGAELTALGARARLEDVAPDLADLVASYRAGLPGRGPAGPGARPDRRRTARAGHHQRARAGRRHRGSRRGGAGRVPRHGRVVLAAGRARRATRPERADRADRRDDPLDTYLVHHPAALLDKPIERVVIDPSNPYVLGPQLLCAATELPLTDGRGADVERRGRRRRPRRRRAAAATARRATSPPRGSIRIPAVDIRGSSGGQIAILETGTGRMLGSTGAGQAPSSVHPGAVYLHQGESYVVDSLDFEDGIAFVRAEDPGYSTSARELTDVAVTGPGERRTVGPVTIGLVPVSVSHTVIGYPAPATRRRGDRLRRTRHADPHPGHHGGDVHDQTGSVAATAESTTSAFPGRCTPPSTPRSGCFRWWPAATAATSAACRWRWARRRERRRSSSTTATRAARASPTAASGSSAPGGRRRRRRSKRASARGMPVVRAIAQVRQRQRPARQGGRRRGAAPGARRAARKRTT